MSVFVILNLIGVSAFAVSGSLKALNHELDILGVLILGAITATGGGFMRDIALNRIPNVFNDSYELPCAVLISVIAFFVGRHLQHRKKIIRFFDGVGLAVFCSAGAEIAIQNAQSSLFGIIFASVITATGGGMLRDLLVRETPFILNKDVYATLCILGAMLSYSLNRFVYVDPDIRPYIVAGVVFVARMLVITFNLRLPKGTLKS